MRRNIGIVLVLIFMAVIVVSMSFFLTSKKENTENTTQKATENIVNNDGESVGHVDYEDVTTEELTTESNIEVPNSSMTDDEIRFAFNAKGVEDIEKNGVIYEQGETVSYGFIEYKLKDMIVFDNVYDYEDKIPDYVENSSINHLDWDIYQEGYVEYVNEYKEYVMEELGEYTEEKFIYVSLEIKNITDIAIDKYIIPEMVTAKDFVLCGGGTTCLYLTGTSEQAEENHRSFAYLQPGETRQIDAVMVVGYWSEEPIDVNDYNIYLRYEAGLTTPAETPINETNGYILIQGEPEFR